MHTGPHRNSGLVSRLRLPCIDLRVAGDEARDSLPRARSHTGDDNRW